MSTTKTLLPVYLITGSDAPKVQRAVSALKRRVVTESGSDLNLTVLDAAQRDVQEVLLAIDSPGLVLGHRTVVVLNADSWKVHAKDMVIGRLGDLPPETTVAFVGSSFPKNDKLLRAVAAVGKVLAYDTPRRREYPEWLSERAASLGIRLGSRESRRFIQVVGEDPWRVDSELAKLAAYVGGTASQRDKVPATLDDIEAVCCPSLDAQVWDLTDAVGRHDAPAAFAAFEQLVAISGETRGGRPRTGRTSDPVRGILGALKGHLTLLDKVHGLGVTEADAVAKQLSVHPFRARKLIEQAQTFDRRLVRRALVNLARADADMVGGSQLEPVLVLERALAEILRA